MKNLRRSLHVFLIAGILGAGAAAPAPAEAAHPMENMMKRVEQMFNARNARGLAKMLTVVGQLGPEEFKEWEKISSAGAAAAAAGDFTKAKKACADCHDKYRDQFKAKAGSGKGGPKPVD